MGDHTRTITTETMNRRLFITLAAAALLTFVVERYAGWYNAESVVNVFVKTSYLRILFFVLFGLQASLALCQYVKHPDTHLDTLPGVLLFTSIVAAALAFCLYEVPMHALHLIVRLLAPCFR